MSTLGSGIPLKLSSDLYPQHHTVAAVNSLRSLAFYRDDSDVAKVSLLSTVNQGVGIVATEFIESEFRTPYAKRIDDSRVLVGYEVGGGSGCLRIVSIEGDSISYGSRYVYDHPIKITPDGTDSDRNLFDLEVLSSTKGVVVWFEDTGNPLEKSAKSIALSFSGTSVSGLGSQISLPSGVYSLRPKLERQDDTNAKLIYKSNYRGVNSAGMEEIIPSGVISRLSIPSSQLTFGDSYIFMESSGYAPFRSELELNDDCPQFHHISFNENTGIIFGNTKEGTTNHLTYAKYSIGAGALSVSSSGILATPVGFSELNTIYATDIKNSGAYIHYGDTQYGQVAKLKFDSSYNITETTIADVREGASTLSETSFPSEISNIDGARCSLNTIDYDNTTTTYYLWNTIVSSGDFIIEPQAPVPTGINLSDALITHIPFTNGSLEDISGSGNDVTTSATSFCKGFGDYGSGVQTTGSNTSYINFANTFPDWSKTENSVSFWVNAQESLTGSTQKQFMSQWHRYSFHADDNNVQFKVVGIPVEGGGEVVKTVDLSPAFSSGEWHHIALTMGSGVEHYTKMKFWLDGEAIGSGVWSGQYKINTNDSTLYFGTEYDDGGFEFGLAAATV